MKVAILLNSSLANPSVSEIVSQHELVGIGVGRTGGEEVGRLADSINAAGAPIYTFERSSHETEMSDWLRDTQAEVVFVYTFNFKIAQSCLDIPKYGFYNFHPGALPEERGSPLFWAIRDRRKMCTLTVHRMTKHLDSGPIYDREDFQIDESTTFGEALDALAVVSKRLSLRLLNELQQNEGHLRLSDQNAAMARFYRNPKRADIVVDWRRQTAEQVQALTNACNPFCEGAIAIIDGRETRILEASPIMLKQSIQGKASGVPLSQVEGDLCIACLDNTILRIDVLCDSGGYYSGRKWLSHRYRRE